MADIYISVPNPVMICVDKAKDYIKKGRLYHPYNKEEIRFENVEQAFRMIESFYNELRFPFSGVTERTFANKKTAATTEPQVKQEMLRVMSNEELMEKRGEKATFLLQVQHRHNGSWNGKLGWIEEQRTEHFQSVLELGKLIDDLLGIKGKSF